MRENFRDRISRSIGSDVGVMAGFNDLKDDLIDAHQMLTSERALKAMIRYDYFKLWRRVDFIILLVISFYERPLWCTPDFEDYCRVSPDNIAVPTSNIDYFPSLVYYPIEAALILFLTYNRYLKQVFLPNRETKMWFYILCGLTSVIIIEGIVKAVFKAYHVNVSIILKPIFFISFNRDLRKSLSTYILVVRRIIPILCMMASSTLFFSLLGRIIFYDQSQSTNYFETSFLDTVFNLIVLQTTSNFPDVMMDFYNTHRWAPIFFMSYLILNLFILLNTVLGVFYSSYKHSLEKDIHNFLHERRERLELYVNQYLDMKSQRQSKLPSSTKDQTVAHFLQDCYYNNGIIYNKLNKTSNKFKKRQESQLSNEQLNFVNNNNGDNSNQNQPDDIDILSTTTWQTIMGFLALITFLGLYFMVPDFTQGKEYSRWTGINFTVNTIFLSEQLSRLIKRGKNYWSTEKKYYIFDFIASIIITCLIVAFWASDDEWLLTPCMYLICTRMLRFFYLFMKIKAVRTICVSLYEFIPHFVKLFGVLIVAFFFFSAIGQHIFGGHMTYAYQEIIYTETGEELYILNSFNDTATSLILLFELLIVNNWMVNVQTHQIVMNTKNVRFFFIVWYFVAVIVCMNIMVAFIIDNLVNKFPHDDDDDKNNQTQHSSFISEASDLHHYNHHHHLDPNADNHHHHPAVTGHRSHSSGSNTSDPSRNPSSHSSDSPPPDDSTEKTEQTITISNKLTQPLAPPTTRSQSKQQMNNNKNS